MPHTPPTLPALRDLIPEKIPEFLKAQKRWAPWRSVWIEKRQKYDKRPVHWVKPHYGISTAKPNAWGTYEQALSAVRTQPGEFAGLGFVLTDQHDVIGIDLDKCVDGNTIAPWALEVLEQVDSYTEISPSGNGLRIFAKGTSDQDWANHEVGIEVYSGNAPRFLTVTGQRLKRSPIDLAHIGQATLTHLASRYAKTKTTADVITLHRPDVLPLEQLPTLSNLPLTAKLERFLTTGEHDGDRSRILWAASMGLHNAGLTEQEVFSMLVSNEFVMEVALDHRRQDPERAEQYLWREHCQKSKAKASSTTSLASFDDLDADQPPTPTEGPPTPPTDVMAMIDVLPPEPTKLRFPAQPASLFAGGAPPTWWIKKVLPRAELVVLFGESGSGKSFMALDMALAIAQGLPWRGHKTRQGKVVYIAAEGAGGFRNRLTAYCLAHEIDITDLDDCFFVINAAPNFMVKDDALDIVKSIKECGPVAMVIVDTWAQVMPGANENSGEDVGKALQHCKGIYRSTRATVCLVHHAGKDTTKGARGWSGLRAAADAELEVVRLDTGRYMRVSKQKDGEDGAEFGFELAPVVLGVDEDGDRVSSCSVVDTGVPEKPKGGRSKHSGKWGLAVLAALDAIGLVQSTGIERSAVIQEAVGMVPEAEGMDLGMRKKLASRALTEILKDGESCYVLDELGCIELNA